MRSENIEHSRLIFCGKMEKAIPGDHRVKLSPECKLPHIGLQEITMRKMTPGKLQHPVDSDGIVVDYPGLFEREAKRRS